MYQTRKKQIKWQFELPIPDNPQSQPVMVIKDPNIVEKVEDKQQSEPKIQQQIENQGEKQEQVIQNQSMIKEIVGLETKSKNYHLKKRKIYLINNKQVCDQECQYSPIRKSQLYEKENNAHQYTIDKKEPEQQPQPKLSNIADKDFEPSLPKKESSQLEQEERNLKQLEEDLLQKIVNLQIVMKKDSQKESADSNLMLQISSLLERAIGLRDDKERIIGRLIEMMKENVEKQNKEIKKQENIINNWKLEEQSKSKSRATQTPKQFEKDQNELPKLLGYQAQTIEQDLAHNEYVVTYTLKRGYSIITFKPLTKINQSEELNKIIMDFAEKYQKQQLLIIRLDLRIQGYKKNFLPYARLVENIIINRYSTEKGQIGTQHVSNIIKLLPYQIKKLRKLEKQLVQLQEYGCLWTQQFSECRILILLGYRTMLHNETVLKDQICFRIDCDLVAERFEFKYLDRYELLYPFHPLKQYQQLKEGKILQMDNQLYQQIQEKIAHGSLTQILRLVNISKQN